ncbi:MAG: hypothetical protein LBV28_00555 [Puniceicoccales bacterium]|jgi:hypothetical protein|nr:hypothetical protein [Puniceicoccales bacterium]
MSRQLVQKFSLFSLIGAVALFCSGCFFVPFFADDDMSGVERRNEQMEKDRMDRMSRNPHINQTEYQALEAQSGRKSSLPPRPNSVEELEKRVEADKAAAARH